MENTNWLKQVADKPLFPDLLWSRPENKRQAGKLLIVGGNLHGFAVPMAAYNAATAAGIGSARVILPEKLKKALGTSFTEAEFAPSTPSGSLSRQA
jgi:NAD(P)H-hydrate repair Nnr-like enzyme with NAD(P)H-hydrate dehydratase domain